MLQKFQDKKPLILPSVYIADSAELVGEIKIGEDSSVWNRAVLRGDMNYIEIGKNTSVQDGSIIHGTLLKYPTIIGDNVSIGHGAIVHGCIVGNNCIIGMGAIILEGAEIGNWCIIGAGTVVPEKTKIPDESLVLGVPGKVVKKIDEVHKQRIIQNWQNYVELKNAYLRETRK